MHTTNRQKPGGGRLFAAIEVVTVVERVGSEQVFEELVPDGAAAAIETLEMVVGTTTDVSVVRPL